LIYYSESTERLLTEDDVVSENSNISFPRPFNDEVLESLGLVHYMVDAKPIYDPVRQCIKEGRIEVRDGVARRTHIVEDLAALTTKANIRQKKIEVRAKRNQLLRETDWTVLPDSPLLEADKQDWMEYRQELRDFPSNPDFPFTEEWPEDPIEEYGQQPI
jgi:hypothetical protein